MRIINILILSFVVLLSACHNQEVPEETTLPSKKKSKLTEAAGYNVRLGIAYLKQGDMVRAKRKLIQALEQSPNMPDANVAMGFLLEKSGEIIEAKKYFKKAIALAPNSGAQENNYGTFLCRQGDYKQAEYYFLKAAHEVQYDNTASAYENAGLCAMSVNELDKAITFFKMALQQDPKRTQSLYELVQIEMKKQDYKAVLDDLKRFPEITLKNNTLLKIAVSASEHTNSSALADEYRAQLKSSNFSEEG